MEKRNKTAKKHSDGWIKRVKTCDEGREKTGDDEKRPYWPIILGW